MDSKESTKWKSSTDKWSRKIIKFLSEIVWDMWENRNDFLHHEDHPWRHKDKQQINMEITERYKNFNKKEYMKRDFNHHDLMLYNSKKKLATVGYSSMR